MSLDIIIFENMIYQRLHTVLWVLPGWFSWSCSCFCFPFLFCIHFICDVCFENLLKLFKFLYDPKNHAHLIKFQGKRKTWFFWQNLWAKETSDRIFPILRPSLHWSLFACAVPALDRDSANHRARLLKLSFQSSQSLPSQLTRGKCQGMTTKCCQNIATYCG